MSEARLASQEWREHPEALQLAYRELPSFVMRQRWYPAKDAEKPRLSLHALVPVTSDSALALWKAELPRQPAFQLFIPLAVVAEASDPYQSAQVIGQLPDGGLLIDATASDAFIYTLIKLMAEAPRPDTADLRPFHTALFSPVMAKITRADSIKRSDAEQSNTSVRIGSSMLKVIRKVAAGIHPELEMARFLTDEARFKATPPLLGWIDLGSATLAILQEFIANQGDGWTWVGSRLRGVAADYDKAHHWLSILGTRTAEMHAALRVQHNDPAFCAENAAGADWARWVQGLSAMAARVQDALLSRSSALDPETEGLAHQFEDLMPLLEAWLAEMLKAAPAWAKTRHHGDFHLGQVLVCNDDAVIVDFEGEPLRSLDERRAKHVPLRDVAGLLRSIEYVSAVARRGLPTECTTEQRRDACGRLSAWEAAASQGFLSSYLKRLAQLSDEPFDASAASRIVRFFLMEKALYEVLYEITNRPDWASIPLRKVCDLLAEIQNELRSREA